MKLLERIIKNLIRQQVNTEEMQFGFKPGCGTPIAIILSNCKGNIKQKRKTCPLTLWICRKLLIECL